MSKNKVKERSQKVDIAKFYYTAQRMFKNMKVWRGLLYVVAIIPVVLALISDTGTATATAALVLSVISFGLSLLNDSLSSFLTVYKKKAIMEFQLYETGITGSEFSKIEYDRESTNSLNEFAIRKGLPQMRGRETLYEPYVPADIPDEYSYLYLCRRSAATTNYLLSRIFYIYFIFLILIAVLFVFALFFIVNTEYLILLITFYPVFSPIIKACGKCKECIKDCVKICADIDNYFATGDTSLERLARMQYYVQNIEFEMMTNRPSIYSLYSKMFKKGVSVLEEGVTNRFQNAIVELKGKAMMQKGVIATPKGKTLITKVDYDIETLKKMKSDKKKKKPSAKAEVAAASSSGEQVKKAEEKPQKKTTKPAAKKQAQKAEDKTPKKTTKSATTKQAQTKSKTKNSK